MHISFFSFGSSSYMKKKLPKQNENIILLFIILLLFILADFVGLSCFFLFPYPNNGCKAY